MKKARFILLTFFAMVLMGLNSMSAQTLVSEQEAAIRVATAITTIESNIDLHKQNNQSQLFLEERSRSFYYNAVLLALKHKHSVADAIEMGNVVLPGQEEDAAPADKQQYFVVDAAKKQYVQELQNLLKQ
jgi:hypothetical protein